MKKEKYINSFSSIEKLTCTRFYLILLIQCTKHNPPWSSLRKIYPNWLMRNIWNFFSPIIEFLRSFSGHYNLLWFTFFFSYEWNIKKNLKNLELIEDTVALKGIIETRYCRINKTSHLDTLELIKFDLYDVFLCYTDGCPFLEFNNNLFSYFLIIL